MANFDSLIAQLKESVDEHSKMQSLDSYYYNGITAVVLVATTAATLIPVDAGQWVWVVKILTALATFLIALERSLNFGARWRYHREMRHGYISIIEKIHFYENLPDSFPQVEREKYYLEIYNDLNSLRRRESEIPGTGGISNLEAPRPAA